MRNTRKILSAVLSAAMLLTTFAVCISAANDSIKNEAFTQTWVDAEHTVLWDDPTTKDKGGWGKEIAYYEGNLAIGLSSLNDYVLFPNMDFGANGAKEMAIHFGYGNDDGTVSTLAVYMDDLDSDPICTYDIKYTGGWGDTPEEMEEYVADVEVPGGVHDIYVVFTSEKSGSFNYISFTEAAPKKVAKVDNAAQTSDGVVTLAIFAAVASAGALALTKRRAK